MGLKRFLSIVAMLALCASSALAQSADDPAMTLWYRQPADNWLQAMPMGNGILGAMVFGKTDHERIALNEGTFWSGRPHDYNNPDAIHYFPKIRDLVFAGKFQEAEKMADEHFFGVPAAQQAYEPIGDLNLDFDGSNEVGDYRRSLDIEAGVATIRYRSGDATYTREVFVSYPDRVIVVHLTCDKPGRISLGASFKSPYLDQMSASGSDLLMDGTWRGPMRPAPLIATVDGKGIRFRAALRAIPQGGQISADQSGLHIKNADAATLLVSIATSFVNYHDISGDPAPKCSAILSSAAPKDFATLLSRHVEDFRGLMGRVKLNVGDEAMNQSPTDQRLKDYRAGKPDPGLEAQCFQFGRYLLASSSRAGGQPANLQGIWNESVTPNWGSKYTININTEMNYWPAEVCNLSECTTPLFDMIKDISVTGTETAKEYYGRDGWVTHHNIDLWRGTAPVDAARFGMWPVGGAWLCQHLWEHYAFTGDREFLKAWYPVMKGSAEFLVSVLVEEPKHHWLVTPFSMSPEHGYYDSEGKLCFLSPGPTLDIAIMRELFPHCIEASKLLDIDQDFRGKLEAALKRLPPYRINSRGFVQEWIEDWKPGNQGHNVSPDFAFFPGSSITLRGQPDLANAYLKWMDSRRPRGGWPTAWDICMWARLEKGDKVSQWMRTFVTNSMADNLQNRGANQSDANFGFTAGIAESLLQSHAGEISLLPALPADWPDGSVTGLKARGGFAVDMQWKSGKLVSATIHNAFASSSKLRSGSITKTIDMKPREMIRLDANLEASH